MKKGIGILVFVLIFMFPAVVLAAGAGERDNKPMVAQMDSMDNEMQTMDQGGRYSMEIVTSPNPLVKGEASLSVKLSSRDGQAVEGAVIKVQIQMDPEMGGHGEMSDEPLLIELKPAEEPGTYEGELELDSVGEWIANFEITYPNGQRETFENKLEVVYDGPNKIFLGAITGIILISIFWARTIKKRQGKDVKTVGQPTA